MDQDHSELLPDTAVLPPRGTALSRLVRVFTSPGEVFRELRVTPTWLAPMLALVVLTLAAQMVIVPRIDMERTIREAMAQRSSSQQISDEQMDKILAAADKWKWAGPVAAVILGPLVLALIGGLYHLGLRAFGAESEFKPILATYLHASWPPGLVLTVVTSVVALQRGSFSGEEAKTLVKAGLDALLPASAPGVLHAVAGVFNVFNVWQWILLVMGFEIVAKVKRGQAIALVAAVWGVWVLVKIGGALLKAAF